MQFAICKQIHNRLAFGKTYTVVPTTLPSPAGNIILMSLDAL